MRMRLLSLALLVAATAAQAAPTRSLDQEFSTAHAERRTQMCAAGFAALADTVYDDIAHHRLSDRAWHENSRDFAAYLVQGSMGLTQLTKLEVEKDRAADDFSLA